MDVENNQNKNARGKQRTLCALHFTVRIYISEVLNQFLSILLTFFTRKLYEIGRSSVLVIPRQ